MLPNNQCKKITTPSADQEKNQGASRAMAWTAPKKATLAQLSVSDCLPRGAGVMVLEVIEFPYCRKLGPAIIPALIDQQSPANKRSLDRLHFLPLSSGKKCKYCLHSDSLTVIIAYLQVILASFIHDGKTTPDSTTIN